MRRLILSIVLVFGAAINIPMAEAAAPEWAGTQYQGAVGAETALTDHVAARGSVHYFRVPKTDLELFFTYFGPKFMVTDWFWTAPQVGTVSGWFDGGNDGLNLSLWNGLTFGDFSAFLEVDGYFSPDHDPNLYGYCSLDANRGKVVPANFGLQIEEIETDFTFGPHLGFTKDLAHFEAQYYISGPATPLQTHTVRFLTSINF